MEYKCEICLLERDQIVLLSDDLMEEHLTPLAVTHLLQRTLRIYAVFWRILPRNYPPPKWEGQGAYDRSRGNRRNWYVSSVEVNFNTGAELLCLVNFNSLETVPPRPFMGTVNFSPTKDCNRNSSSRCPMRSTTMEKGMQYLCHLRTWEAQFLSSIKTIAFIAVREGVVQLGAVHKDLSYVVLLRKKFSYIESIPGVLLPHPSSSAYPYKVEGGYGVPEQWHFQGNHLAPQAELYENHFNMPLKITPSMSSLEALLSKLPSMVPPPHPTQPPQSHHHHQLLASPQQRPLEFVGSMQKVAKEELEEEVCRPELDISESSTSIPGYHHQHHFHQDQNNVTRSGADDGF
ncbi:hypothetical protein V8G54_008115 [Vigna mungo]|uniref:Uncharacterized protein n=1 Tax=Vigna mungo TaxID=3915 RepID=A0AAQ3S8Y1_VIGMU